MYRDEKKPSELAKVLSSYDCVFIDTCSLMDNEFPIFMDTLSASKKYWKKGFQITILKDVENELKKHKKCKDEKYSDARIDAKKALRIIRKDRRKHLFNRNKRVFTFHKQMRDDGFADCALSTLVTELRIDNRVLVITQDRKLASDLLKLNNSQSQFGKKVDVLRINSEGWLGRNDGIEFSGHSHDKYAYRVNDKANKKVRNRTKTNYKTKTNKPTKNKGSKKAFINVEDVKKADFNLKANLNNPNLKKSDKKHMINKQLYRINNLDENKKQSLSLTYKIEDLEELKEGLYGKKSPQKSTKSADNSEKTSKNTSSNNENKKSVKVNNKKRSTTKSKPVLPEKKTKQPKPETNKPNTNKHNQTSTTKNTVAKKANADASFGATPFIAISECCERKGILFRDETIEYVSFVHGKYDVTLQQLERSIKDADLSKQGVASTVKVGELSFVVTASKGGYTAYIAEENTNETKAKNNVTIKPTNAKESDNKPAKAKGPDNKPAKSKEPNNKPQTNIAKKEKKSSDKVKKQPSVDKKKVQKAKSEAPKKNKTNKKEYKNNKGQDKNKTTTPQKKNSGANIKTSPKPNKTGVQKKNDEKANNKQSKPKLTTKQINDKALEEAKAFEKSLKANIKNPTYSNSKKLRDLIAQKKRVENLTPRRKSKMELGVDKLENLIKELETNKD